MLQSERTKLTPPEVARLWGISPDKVLAWIRSGELRAINAAMSTRGRPRYLIDVKDLEDFENRRAVASSVSHVRDKRTRRKADQSGIIQFF
jgi:excisionase family DNA binding protein